MSAAGLTRELALSCLCGAMLFLRQSKMDRAQRKGIREEGGLIRKQRTGTKSSRLEKYLPFLDSYLNLQVSNPSQTKGVCNPPVEHRH
jgi:hypothetical protein